MRERQGQSCQPTRAAGERNRNLLTAVIRLQFCSLRATLGGCGLPLACLPLALISSRTFLCKHFQGQPATNNVDALQRGCPGLRSVRAQWSWYLLISLINKIDIPKLEQNENIFIFFLFQIITIYITWEYHVAFSLAADISLPFRLLLLSRSSNPIVEVMKENLREITTVLT